MVRDFISFSFVEIKINVNSAGGDAALKKGEGDSLRYL